jgi:hypothetical protein
MTKKTLHSIRMVSSRRDQGYAFLIFNLSDDLGKIWHGVYKSKGYKRLLLTKLGNPMIFCVNSAVKSILINIPVSF